MGGCFLERRKADSLKLLKDQKGVDRIPGLHEKLGHRKAHMWVCNRGDTMSTSLLRLCQNLQSGPMTFLYFLTSKRKKRKHDLDIFLQNAGCHRDLVVTAVFGDS